METFDWKSEYIPSFPITVTWEVSYKCNLRCIHCYSDSGPPRDEIPLKKCQEIIDQLGQVKVFKILFGGGEPFAREDFFAILEYAHETTRMELHASTNGYYITPATAARVRELGLRIQVSLDGGTETTHDTFRGLGAFRQAMRATRTLREAGIPVSWGITMGSRVSEEIGQVADLARKMDVYQCTFRHLFPVGRAGLQYPNIYLSPSAWPDVKRKLEEVKEMYAGSVKVQYETLMDRLLSKAGTCIPSPAGIQHCVITPEANILTCQYLRDPEFIVGNLWKEPFESIWSHSPVLNRFRNVRQPWTCRDCLANCGIEKRGVTIDALSSTQTLM